MDPKIEKIIDILKESKMTEGERSLMRQNLLSTIEGAKSRSELGSTTGKKIHTISKPSPYTNWTVWQWFIDINKTYAITAFALVMILSGGVSFAAKGTLPGDLLYPIKIAVNENVLRTFSKTSPVAEVDFETTIMQERLVEAEQLDKNNKLNSTNETDLQNSIVNQNGRVNQAIAKLGNASPSTPNTGETGKKEDKSPRVSVSATSQTLITASTTDNISSKDNGEGIEDNIQEAKKAVEKVNAILKDHRKIMDRIGLDGLNSKDGESENNN